ncbi:uncharacterized protein A4U43_C06F15620 [Asparagus officinalis]|uniref:Uncharacterized protein n=4 Tax=Asparagus officinalis TaxID=4686 RepID=A0A5P1EN58_ASPOF|nr:uncharacterized protein A4U43_C06F15620 [Asparagus officinalis]
MVEEIHSLEMRQQNKAGASDANHNTDKQPQLPSSSTATSSNDTSFFHNQNQSSKRPHDELSQVSHHIQEPNYNFVFDGFHGHHNIEVGGGVGVKENGDVSLTLGLHQNNGICLADPIPLNVVHGFGLGLEECNDPYVIGSFGGQDRQFGKDIGGRLLHDFVG